jgi:predicted DNA repair protein MutK
MSGGLAALLDDIAAIAKVAAASIDDIGAAAGKASAKAVGVVVDDTAVTPRYVHGFLAQRELPIIWKIAKGSLRNKLVFILPVAILLSQFVPWAMTPLLMIGGTYLGFEGAEKVLEALLHTKHGESPKEALAELGTPEHERKMISGAIRTDFILSAEIMAIALAEVASEPVLSRILILVVVGVVITALVYGVAGLIVKLDDIGLALTERKSRGVQAFGRGLVAAMPVVMRVLSVVGIAAMIWVGGHLILVGANTLGLYAPYALVHHASEAASTIHAVGGFLAWLVVTLCSALVGLVVGFAIVGVMHVIPKRKPRPGHEAEKPAGIEESLRLEHPAPDEE